MRRGLVALGGGLALGLAVAVALYDRDQPPLETAQLRELRAAHEALHEELESLLSKQPLLGEKEVESGDVVVAIRTKYLRDLIRDVSSRYLERVSIDMAPEIHVHEGGEIKKKTFLGTMTLGQWEVTLDVKHLQGVLSAHAPDLAVAPGNAVRGVLPVDVLSGTGAGTIRFSWNPNGMTSVVCHDFTVSEQLEATILPDKYRVRGGFTLVGVGDQIVARPTFPREKFRIRVDLVPASWQKVRQALEAQDTVGRCGLAMDPEQVVSQLAVLAKKGFDVTLPDSLFQPIVLPAGFHSEVAVAERKADVEIKSALIRLTEETLWYGVAVKGRIVAR